ncbi:membrane hypothetical protein [Candidatus Magnetomorum sp. HK-1]|nr:membrane hypothetical protein [Candidatus Magnetomorum sp. HK-1]
MVNKEIVKDIFIELYREHGLWSRHQESQRAVVSNLIITIAAALIGLVVFDNQINNADTPATIFIILLGVFGTLFSYKYYERFHFHDSRIEAYKTELDKFILEVNISAIENEADKSSRNRFRFLRKLGLFQFWIMFNLSILLLGLILSTKALTTVTNTEAAKQKTQIISNKTNK